MAFLKNTISLLAVFCVVPTAFGASARVGVVANSAARMPTLHAGAIAGTSSVSTTSSSTSLMSNAECIDAYTECIKGEDVCGSELEECTTNVLFHGKMPLCFSTLYQCQSSGISTLFGTSAIDALSNVSTTNTAGEVTRYTYPTDGSVLGQLIIGANITNRYKDSATCVKKYKSCMYRDTVCGEDFELCTDSGSFKKQAPMCDSVLALCPSAGIDELFGTTNATVRPNVGYGSGTVAQWVSDGADLAAANAVNTCYKVVDNCFLSACGTNPYRCVEGVDLSVVQTADIVGAGDEAGVSVISSDTNAGEQSASNVRKFFKSACIDTIGTNKYCYMTFHDGKSPKKTDLTDPDSQEDLFSEAYTARKTYINTKLQTLVEDFDTKTKKSCVDTIKSCAMRSCGGGSGAACYTETFGRDGLSGPGSVGLGNVYTEIKRACEPLVNTSPACRYSAAVVADDNTYSYSYSENSIFTTLFGSGLGSASGGVGARDPIKAVATLDSLLATTYNAAGIAQLQKQCENVATNCVKSMCGTDYVNCYRSRTDISGTVYKDTTSESKFGSDFTKSMNKLGGVLDYNVVLGLCQNTVKNSSSCEEHLSIIKGNIGEDVNNNLWGNSVGETWLGTTVNTGRADQVQATDANGAKLCTCGEDGATGICENETGGDPKCTKPYWIDISTAVMDQATSTLFQNLLAGIEKEAQALYQSKLIKQRNTCEAQNNGGIVGANDMASSTFMWAKLAGNGRVPSDYSTRGLESGSFTQTNDLYGGFCRMRVEVKSDDIYVNQYLGESAVRYFAVGDAFTCGSWITMDDLNKITSYVADNAIDQATLNKQKRTRNWLTALAGVGGLVGGFAGMDAIQKGNGTLGGILPKNRSAQQSNIAEDCNNDLDKAEKAYTEYLEKYSNDMAGAAAKYNEAVNYANSALTKAKRLQKTKDKKDSLFDDIDKINFSNATASTGQETVTQGTTTYSYDAADLIRWTGLRNDLSMLATKCLEEKDPNHCYLLNSNSKKLTELLATSPTDANGGVVDARSFASAAVDAARNCTQSWAVSGNNFTEIAKQLPDPNNIQKWTLEVVTNKTADTTKDVTNYTFDSKFNANLLKVRNICENIDDVDNDQKGVGRLGTNAIAGGALGLGLGFTTYYGVEAIQKTNNEQKEQDAIDEWMNNIGSKIKCYIGAQEAGSYGQIITTTLDDM